MSVGNLKQIVRYSCLSPKFEANYHYIDIPEDLSFYVVRMIALGVSQHLEYSCPRVLSCLKLM